ncbi:MAG: Gldg family protein [Deltaproteobacteria bacterium]|nr:Gldg family protein [Deltaproteobacteria bacterium]MBW2418511.1 Gldg family protein [Deltaproteobacteria bacterium]
MSSIGIVARKEFRSYFQSPVAVIFLGIFLFSTLFSFFGSSAFFARNIADVRPLFEWLPLLLIFLVAAITMRQWSEERKMGTLEVLLTLPVTTRDMVLGKFLAGVALVALALAFTLPIPIMVSLIGDLDWGPVVGGYLGALLLGSTYLAIGLCVSARTDNQVVSLMLTLVIGGAIYLLGSDVVTAFFGNRGADLLRALGTGSRFTSIERGVLDLRDLVYYVGLAAFFLTLNWYFLELDRVDVHSKGGRPRARALALLVLLAGVNVIACNVWLTPVKRARADLTRGGEYSVSAVTRQTLAALEEPLEIQGFFSARTHPLLAPLVPQIRDLLAEYEVQGDGKVRVSFADPNADEELEQELSEQYGIRSVPFQVADRHEQAVVNSYFHVLVRYADQYETLSFAQLIEVRADQSDIDVRLRNLEYDLTRTIKRVSQEFQSMESIFARLPEPATVTLYATPGQMPEEFAELPGRIRGVADTLAARSDGKLVFAEVDPAGNAQLQEELDGRYGIRPLAVDLFGRQTFYLDLVVESGDKVQRILPRSELSEADIEQALEAAVRRATPGQLKTIGLLTETPAGPPRNPQLPPQFQPPAPQPDYQVLQRFLEEDYEVERLDLSSGIVPDIVDVLVVGKAGALSEHEQFALDQYLMRGGRVIALAGRYAVDSQRGGLAVSEAAPALFSLLEAWGVEVEPALVMDSQNAPFPIPVTEERGGFRMQRIQLIPYPFFVDIRSDGFNEEVPALSGLPSVTAPWSSPLRVNAAEGIESKVLLASSDESWLNTSADIQPDFRRYPDGGFAPGAAGESRTLGVALGGRFPSAFAERPSPLFGEGGGAEAGGDATGRTLKESLPDAQLVVLGSSEMVSDLLLQLAGSFTGEVHRSNYQLVQNLVDWAVEDTDLLTIRSSGAFAHTLRPMEPGEARTWEIANYAFVTLLLLVISIVPRRLRRNAKPIVTLAGEGRS